MRIILLYALMAWVPASAEETGLVIEILRGAGTNNNVVSRVAASPVVRVLDGSGKPVPGALVVFTAPSKGASVEFGAVGNVAQAVSDESGTAVAPRVRPLTADGPVEIKVLATKDGRSANASIVQMNLGLTAAPDPPDALEIVALADAELPPPAISGRRQFGFRVETAAGKPVSGAQVEVTVETMKRGKPELLGRTVQTSAPNGLVIAAADARGEPVEISIRATLGGRNATRYFSKR